MEQHDTDVFCLGDCKYDSPLSIPMFIDEGERVIISVDYGVIENGIKARGFSPSFDNAGPRKKIYFDPSKTTAAIVTCGGLCPGINNVIKSIVSLLLHQYRIKAVYGIQYGYEGLVPSYGHDFVDLSTESVDDLHEKGGSMLGSSRGLQDVQEMVDTLVKRNVNILFTIGGDGTLKGANAIFEEVKKRGLDIAVVCVPKTIDNDIVYVDRTFGFNTAVSVATEAVKGAHAEAKGYRNGIGLVKLMGRDSGFIAAYTALASNEANYVFIPEVPFKLYGEHGFLPNLQQRLMKRRHAVVIIAEGAGQELFSGEKKYDASGNVKYGDVGILLRESIIEYFKKENFHINLKYIDPSYIIRSVPASADDAVFCIMLSQNAVHGAMAGKSGILVGRVNKFFTFIPMKLAIEGRKKIDANGYLWSIVKEATGQPDFY
jgi:6-phosphofructokinase 1